jgi:hypothetical protein
VSELDKVLIKSTKKMVEIRKQSDRGLSYAWPWLSFLFPIETVTTHTLVKVGPRYICRVDGTGSTSSIQMRDGWEPKPLGGINKDPHLTSLLFDLSCTLIFPSGSF